MPPERAVVADRGIVVLPRPLVLAAVLATGIGGVAIGGLLHPVEPARIVARVARAVARPAAQRHRLRKVEPLHEEVEPLLELEIGLQGTVVRGVAPQRLDRGQGVEIVDRGTRPRPVGVGDAGDRESLVFEVAAHQQVLRIGRRLVVAAAHEVGVVLHGQPFGDVDRTFGPGGLRSGPRHRPWPPGNRRGSYRGSCGYCSGRCLRWPAYRWSGCRRFPAAPCSRTARNSVRSCRRPRPTRRHRYRAWPSW